MKLLEIPEQTPVDDVDEEILEIFVEEVQEVQEEIVNNFSAWQADITNKAALQDLRRAFHTLKGSGRLVGATVIGEVGWRFENMLNRVIDGTIEPGEQMFQLIAQVDDFLPGLIEDFKQAKSAPHAVRVLVSQADYFTQTKGESIGDFDTETLETEDTAAVPESTVKSEKPTPPKLEQASEEKVAEEDETEVFAEDSEEAFTSEVDSLEGLEEDTDWGTGEELESDWETSETDWTDETDTLEPLSELEEFDETEEVEAFDSLDSLEEEGLAATETPPVIEELSNLPLEEEENEPIDPELFKIFKSEAMQHVVTLQEFFKNYQEETTTPLLDQEVVRSFHTLNGSSRSVNLVEVSAIAGPMENYARTLNENQTPLTTEILDLAQNAINTIHDLLEGEDVAEETRVALIKDIHQAEEAVLVVKPPVKEEKTATAGAASAKSQVFEVPDATDEFMAIFLEEAEEILENTQSLLERWQESPQNMQLMKELQRELHTLKGGARMVEITPMGDLSHQLESVLTKIVEGNAQSNPKLQEIVQNSVDELAAMLEAVRAGVALEMPNDLIKQIGEALYGDGGMPVAPVAEEAPAKEGSAKEGEAAPASVEAERKEVSDASVEEAESTAGRAERGDKDSDMVEAEDRIRVRVALIDKLTNLAGELSISRAHMEQQQGVLKNHLNEMEQTVTRLRDQLRRLEIETEAQIISSFQEMSPDDEEFDPLELDRFSVMQQLSRSLMETINDLANIQDYLKTTTRQSDSLLIQQTRIGAELQDAIMRTRMIPFSRISPRLQRIARLTARELRKQIEFGINGETIEFERTILNRIVAPLEHMLRNAIGHGIEDASVRQQAGKPPVAKVKIDLSREGTDLIISLSDDGAGLNLPAIRKKAEERGMITPDAVVSDRELMQFILEPSFSTAKTITQVSGRGVGMDVVSTEIKQLGGSLQIYSKSGQGTTFEVRLPLSLTINQALLVHIGEETMAVPLNHVDAVMRVPRQSVANSAEEERYYSYMDNQYRVFHLGELLGFGKTASVDASLIPTLFVRTGDRRLALLVDGIEGSKEIVVKPVGPQIGMIRWIAGATILGDGRVVLILDIPTLTRIDTAPKYETQSDLLPVEEEEKPAPTTIMVVDDSITVRKVTARLLKRQGMEVFTAKDGVDAVAQLQEHVPDLMLLDVEMPRMDGYELATQVRNTGNLKHIPIIMITSRTGAKHRDRAEKIGINRYLGKPFNETELLENINDLLNENKKNSKSPSMVQ